MITSMSYVGSKKKLVKWITSFFPKHLSYVEAFGGSGAILLNKVPSKIEVFNDIDGNIVNFFKVLRHPKKHKELMKTLDNMPYARDLHLEIREKICPHCGIVRHRKGQEANVEWAADYYYLTCTGFSGKPHGGFAFSFRRNRVPMLRRYREMFPKIVERLRDVCIENIPFDQMFDSYDIENMLWYLDPPYLGDSRTHHDFYLAEMTDANLHESMLKRIISAKGKVILSGYESELYNDHLKGWHKEQIQKKVSRSKNDGGSFMVDEMLWMNFIPA